MNNELKSTKESALFVMDGVKGGHDGMNVSSKKKFRKRIKRNWIL